MKHARDLSGYERESVIEQVAAGATARDVDTTFGRHVSNAYVITEKLAIVADA